MAEQKKKPRLTEDKLVRSVLREPADVPDVQVLTGFLGRSPRKGYWRLFRSPELAEFMEIPEDEIVHHERLEGDAVPMGGSSAVWVKRSTRLQHTRTSSAQAQGEFLGGEIAASYLAEASTATQPGGLGPGQGTIVITWWGCTWGCPTWWGCTWTRVCSQFTFCTLLCQCR